MKTFILLIFFSTAAFATDYESNTGTFSLQKTEFKAEEDSTYLTGSFSVQDKANRMPASTEEKEELKRLQENVNDLTGTFD